MLPAALYPYFILLIAYCLKTGHLMESFFNNNAYVCAIYIALWWLFALICTATACIKYKCFLKDALLIKVMQIPAYICLFIIGVACVMTIFTFIFAAVLLFWCCTSIFLSGIIGAAAIKEQYSTGRLSFDKAVIYGILQFVFTADVACIIIMYGRQVKNCEQCS